MKKLLINISIYVFSILATGFIATPSLAITSMCVKVSGTVAHLVTWTEIEKMTFQSTIVRSFAEGPNTPPGGIEAFDSWPTDAAQPVGHFVIGAAPGLWQIGGDSNQFAIISINPIQVITNPDPDACIEDHTLP